MIYNGDNYTGYFDWDCPNCGHKNNDEVDHANDFTCVCKNCKKEYEIYLEIEVDIDKIIECQN